MNSRSNYWCFTLNNPTDNHISLLDDIGNNKSSYLIYQKEIGLNNTPHLQGYIEFDKRIRFSQVKKLLTDQAHIEKRIGTAAQAKHYCMKPVPNCECEHCLDANPPLEDPVEYGSISNPGKKGKRNDLISWKKSIDEGKTISQLWDDHFTTMLRYGRNLSIYKCAKVIPRNFKSCVHIHWGESDLGKTAWFSLSVPDRYTPIVGQSNVWFNDYDGSTPILFDEFNGQIDFNYWKRICDRYPLSAETKGGVINNISPESVFFTSNDNPDSWWSGKLQLSSVLKDSFWKRVNVSINFSRDKDNNILLDITKNNCICNIGIPTIEELNDIINGNINDIEIENENISQSQSDSESEI